MNWRPLLLRPAAGIGSKGRGHVIACAQIAVTCCRAGLDGPGRKGGVWFSQLPVAWLLPSLELQVPI